MDTWNLFVNWLGSEDARPVVLSIALAAAAILLSGILAALIARASVRSLLRQREREGKVAAIAALVDASTEAAVWSSLTPQEQVLADRAVGQADIHLRLLPIRGSALAANWSAHQLAELKRNSATFGFELDPVVAEFRDRLIEWQNKPARAKKIFENDLVRLRREIEPRTSAQDRWIDGPEAPATVPAHTQAPRAAAAPATVTAPVSSPAAAGLPSTPPILPTPPAAPTAPTAPPAAPTAPTAPVTAADAATQRLIDDIAAIETPASPRAEGEPHPL